MLKGFLSAGKFEFLFKIFKLSNYNSAALKFKFIILVLSCSALKFEFNSGTIIVLNFPAVPTAPNEKFLDFN